MKTTLTAIWLGLLLSGSTAPAAGVQSGASAPSPDPAAPSADSAEQGKKKGGGLFGKAKKIAGNKAVQQVAKTMACTMVPGGQVVAGAIDAAASDDVGEAAAGAAGAAAGQPCMPAGLGAGVPGSAAGMAGAAGVGSAGGAAGLAGMALGSSAAGLAGGMPGAAMGDPTMMGGMGPDAMAACMGLSTEELLALGDPTGGEARELTKAETERQARLAAKVDMARYQACMMQPQGADMTATGEAKATSREPTLEDAPAHGKPTEAPGRSLQLPTDPEKALGKGRAVVGDIDWLTSGAEVAESGAGSFAAGMATLAAAMRAVGGEYRVDIYLDKRYQEAALEPIGSARLRTVLSALERAGLDPGVASAGKTKTDKRPRLEIVRTKK